MTVTPPEEEIEVLLLLLRGMEDHGDVLVLGLYGEFTGPALCVVPPFDLFLEDVDDEGTVFFSA